MDQRLEPSAGKKRAFASLGRMDFTGTVQSLVDGKPSPPTSHPKIGNAPFRRAVEDGPAVTKQSVRKSPTTSNTIATKRARTIFGTERFKEDGKRTRPERILHRKTTKKLIQTKAPTKNQNEETRKVDRPDAKSAEKLLNTTARNYAGRQIGTEASSGMGRTTADGKVMLRKNEDNFCDWCFNTVV